jgi:hypothetical protein
MKYQSHEARISLCSSVFSSYETPRASEARPVDRFGRVSTGSMLAIGSEPAVEALPRHRRVLEKSTATMQYENGAINPLHK